MQITWTILSATDNGPATHLSVEYRVNGHVVATNEFDIACDDAHSDARLAEEMAGQCRVVGAQLAEKSQTTSYGVLVGKTG